MLNGIIELVRFAVITFLAAVAANVLVSLAAYVWGKVIRVQGHEMDLRARLARYARIATGLSNRVEARKNTAAGAATHLFSAQRHEKQLKSRIRELENSPHRFVRMIGAEQFPNKPFEFLVINSSVSHQVKRGERHPFYDSSWAQPCPVHVWARGPEEAKAEFERVYPKASGFKAVYAQPLTGAAAPTDSSEEEGAAAADPEMEPV
ncbi:hypothetical protein [Niveispirillum sp.]|uniref:hypothetical protein n=1 Tax=Niveispirillum sp. TaxID=1917217 RepID=UPI001B52C995|nr:hypothetical protein [Niveispirillum sp.]MBP7339707.1 hypothetical protein [Niveispirillum sp.]